MKGVHNMSLLSISDNPSNSKDETGSPGTGIAFRPVSPGAQTPSDKTEAMRGAADRDKRHQQT